MTSDMECGVCGLSVYYDEATDAYYHDVQPRQLATIARGVRPRQGEVKL